VLADRSICSLPPACPVSAEGPICVGSNRSPTTFRVRVLCAADWDFEDALQRHIRAGFRTEVRLGSTHHSRARGRRGRGSGRLSSVAEVQHSRPLRDRPSKAHGRSAGSAPCRAHRCEGRHRCGSRPRTYARPSCVQTGGVEPRTGQTARPPAPCAECIHQQLVEWVPTTARCPSTSTPAPRRSPSFSNTGGLTSAGGTGGGGPG
jgi:hypothetical protein